MLGLRSERGSAVFLLNRAFFVRQRRERGTIGRRGATGSADKSGTALRTGNGRWLGLSPLGRRAHVIAVSRCRLPADVVKQETAGPSGFWPACIRPRTHRYVSELSVTVYTLSILKRLFAKTPADGAHEPFRIAPDSIGPAQQTAEDIPFTRFEGWLKCMRPVDLDEHQRIALQLTFGRFFEQPETDAAVVAADELFRGGGLREQPFAFRRFAGGRDLPSGRYYAVCNDDTGDDGDSLRSELLSYIDLKACGPLSVWDLTDPMMRGVMLAHSIREPSARPFGPSVAVTFHSERGVTSPFYSALKHAHATARGPLVHTDDNFTVYFPLRVDRVSIEKTIDLRLEHVREWFAARVFGGLPTACYIYGRNVAGANEIFDILRVARPELHIDVNDVQRVMTLAANDTAEAERLANDRHQFLLYGAHPEGVGNEVHAPTRTFSTLLALLMFHPRGGSPITEAIGCWLREIGADALVFPSARTNTELDVEDGTIRRMCGWCLVDYRNAPLPRRVLRIVQDPATYIDNRKPFRVSVADPTKTLWKGSFQVRGITERQQIDWRYGKEIFFQTHKFPNDTKLHNKQFRVTPETRQLVSLAEVRATVVAGLLALDDVLEDTAVQQRESVGHWLARYISERIPNPLDDETRLEYGPDWFMYRIARGYVPQIVCPICEYERRWRPDRDPVDEKCPSCGYEKEQKPSAEEIRMRYFRLVTGQR